MSQERVRCNQCGTLLEVTSTTNFVTCGTCDTPLAIRRTGTSIFTDGVEDSSPSATAPAPAVVSPSANAGALQELQRQQEVNRLENQLNRLDIDWERQKEQYKVSGRYGHRYLPTKGGSVWQGVGIAVFGAIWIVFAFGITTGFRGDGSGDTFGPAAFFPLVGVVFVLVGIGWSINAYRKADEYEQAEQRYLSRKDQLRQQIRDLRHGR